MPPSNINIPKLNNIETITNTTMYVSFMMFIIVVLVITGLDDLKSDITDLNQTIANMTTYLTNFTCNCNSNSNINNYMDNFNGQYWHVFINPNASMPFNHVLE